MANVVLTLKQIEDLFQNITTQMLGLDPTAPENQGVVRVAWPTTGAPAWKITQDRIFIRVTPVDNDYNKQVSTQYEPVDSTIVNQVISHTDVISVNWVIYGPNSYDNAKKIRSSLFLSKFKMMLSANKIYLITNVPEVMRVPELYNGQWWDRSDFSANFNQLVINKEDVNYIKSVDVTIGTPKIIVAINK